MRPNIFHSFMFKLGFDTRVRNRVAAALLRSILLPWHRRSSYEPDAPARGVPQSPRWRVGLVCARMRNFLAGVIAQERRQSRPALLDVGCGSFGVAMFLREIPVLGVDREPPRTTIPNLTFQRAAITALPFPDRSFPVVSCIDVLEHLSPADRERAIRELLRVSNRHLVIACPHGEAAHNCDAQFLSACLGRGQSPPSWVLEHQSHSYPKATVIDSQVRKYISEAGRTVTTSLFYCENVGLSRLVRSAAVFSPLLYVMTNLFLGAIIDPLVPSPNDKNSYRMILLADIDMPIHNA